MRNRSLKTDIIVDDIYDLISIEDGDQSALINKLKETFPSLNNEKIDELALIMFQLISKKKADLVEIVSTTPISFKTKNRKTYPVLKETIMSAKKSVTLTGYSISDHFDELLELIILKSKQGVYVELFFNNFEEVKHVFSDINIKNHKFFKVYNYSGVLGDDMASLHAKVLIVDEQKLFISSANLSYHGMVSNIEIGVLIDSIIKSRQVLDIFVELKRTNKFVLINQGD